MAVVESAADSLSQLTLGLANMPRSFSHLSASSDSDLDQKQQQQQQQLLQHLHHHSNHLLQKQQHLQQYHDNSHENSQQQNSHENSQQQNSHENSQQHVTNHQYHENSHDNSPHLPQYHENSHDNSPHLPQYHENSHESSNQLQPFQQYNENPQPADVDRDQKAINASNLNLSELVSKASFDGDRQISSQICTPVQSEALIVDQQKFSLANGDFSSNAGPGIDKQLQQQQVFAMHELEEALPKLNPMAKEFVPSSLLSRLDAENSAANRKQKKNNYSSGKRKLNNKTTKAQLEECVRRTVYVSDIDQQVTEEQLANLFLTCGQVVDCRVCGDPNSVLRFAFVEFTREEEARAALNLAGTMLGFYPVRVLPSKTAILPVNPTFLPRSENEREMCARTVYCTNIDKKVAQSDVKLFFETLCGEVARLRLLGDYRHSTRIAFVEFVRAESAMLALNCSGAILGSLPLRVSPSKTPVRPRSPRFLLQ